MYILYCVLVGNSSSLLISRLLTTEVSWTESQSLTTKLKLLGDEIHGQLGLVVIVSKHVFLQ